MNFDEFGTSNGLRTYGEDPKLVEIIDRELPPQWNRGPERPRQIIDVVKRWFEQKAPTPRKRFQRVVTKIADEHDVSESTIRDACGKRIYDSILIPNEDIDYVEEFIDALHEIEKQYD